MAPLKASFLLFFCMAALAAAEPSRDFLAGRAEGLSYTLTSGLRFKPDVSKSDVISVITEKTLTILETKDGAPVRQRVTYGSMSRKGSVPALGGRTKELEDFPPVSGKTYLVEIDGDDVHVAAEDGAKPPGKEREFVEDDFKKQIKMREKMKKQSEVKRKEKSKKKMDDAPAPEAKDWTEHVEAAVRQRLEEEGLKVETCSITPEGPRNDHGVKRLAFGLELSAGKDSWLIGEATADLKGEASVPLELDAPLSLSLSGTTTFTRKKGLLRLRKGEEKDGELEFQVAVQLHPSEKK